MTELWPPDAVEIVEADGQIVAATSRLRLIIGLDPFSLSVSDGDGAPILTPPPAADLPSGGGEHGPNSTFNSSSRYRGLTYGSDGMRLGSYNGSGRQPRWYTLQTVERWTRDGNTLRVAATSDDVVGRTAQLTAEFLADDVLRLRLTLDRTAGVTEMGIAFATTPDEGYFGLGERFTRTNHRGHEVLNWIEDACFDPAPGHDWTYWPIPYFVSSRGYGVLADTLRRAVFRLGSEREDAWQVSVDGDELDVVVFGGPTPLDVVRQYTALKGRPPLPEPWAFGVWKTALSGDEHVRAEARRLRDEDLGVSALWVYDQLELETNSGWNSAMGYPEGEYPDLPGLVRDLHDEGFKVLGYLNTQFIVGRPRTDEGIAKGYFLKRPDGEAYLVPGPDPNPEVGIRFGTMALYDPTNPAGVAWWQGLLRQMLVDTGYDGWMHDFGEYTPRDAVFADGRTGEEIRNLYPTLYQQTAAEICRQVKPDFSFFVRSGSIGSNQWAPAAWPGDQHTDWSFDRGLPSIIPAALSVGICGTNTWGPDIGGFFDAYDGSDVATSTELWIRWCQFGALTPLMRDHLGPKRMSTPDAIDMWSNEQTIDTWRRYARLHNALVPYLYAYARIAHDTGVPTMRHMVLHAPDQPEALHQDYQYLLGEELLVAPVVEAGATTRRVWFPPGAWYSFWDNTTYSGPGYIEVPAPIEQIPLFVRAGSVLPVMAQPIVTLAGVAADGLLQDLEFRLYPSVESELTAGGFTFHDGSNVQVSSTPERLTLAFDERARSRQLRLRIPVSYDMTGITANGKPQSEPVAATPDGWSGGTGPEARVSALPLGTAEVVLQH